MGADVMAPHAPFSKEDDRGVEQHVVVNIDKTPPNNFVPTPVQHDEDVTTQRPEVEVTYNDD